MQHGLMENDSSTLTMSHVSRYHNSSHQTTVVKLQTCDSLRAKHTGRVRAERWREDESLVLYLILL